MEVGVIGSLRVEAVGELITESMEYSVDGRPMAEEVVGG